MDSVTLNDKIIARGREIFASITDEKPSLFNKSSWMGQMLDWCMRNERFKVQLFRFVDVFPTLKTGKQLTEHIQEYFGPAQDLPPFMASGAKMAGMLGSFGGEMLNKIIAAKIHEMAQQFIIGEQTAEAVRTIDQLRQAGFAATVDLLGEATLSEAEADRYLAGYVALLDALAIEQASWSALPGAGGAPQLDWGSAPQLNIAVKPTALFCLANPQDFAGSVTAILVRLRRICHKVVDLGGFLCIDMESYRYKDIIIEVYRRLKLEFPDYPHLGLALQAYLKDTDQDLADLLAWAREHRLQIAIRLVKGAYWDYEVVRARQNGWEVPVWTIKAETDAAFERQARTILEHHAICHFACGSHNVRTIAAVLELATELQVPPERYEFQVLYGMAEPVRQGIRKIAGQVRLYCPYGDMVPGMGYLVRRLLENTANESFLRHSFAEDRQWDQLLVDPAEAALLAHQQRVNQRLPVTLADGPLGRFRNEPMIDFARPAPRAAFPEALALVRQSLGKTCPLYINGREVVTADLVPSRNPARPTEVVGQVCQAGTTEVELAITAAQAAFFGWRATDGRQRAEYLVRAAAITRRRIFELAAWQVLEIGKQWDQAYADVAEAIDFLEYYAREACRIDQPVRVGSAPGEDNQLSYEPRGVTAVIAPWNFPLAISMGMVSAALVAGNAVVYKPSGLTGVIGYQLVEIFLEAGLPAGLFNYLPGRSATIGDFLVDHSAISTVAFTGSREVGLRIIARAAVVHPGQSQVKRVICEMGGKNAIIVDDDADLDEAIPQILASAFAFQGQKCSACSRVIVLAAVYDTLVARLTAMAHALAIGPAEDPAYYLGAVADEAAQQKVLHYIELGRAEGELLYLSPVPAGEGYFVPLAIFGGITPEHRLAQEEIFGPVLSIMRVPDFTQALVWANSTVYALTGGLFSRHPAHLAQARREFRVGNLYLNRGITGALVERQPFGGARLSGGGTKAGGPDYLLHFMNSRTITENTMRRGFTPFIDGGG